jgi:hypothetical protein
MESCPWEKANDFQSLRKFNHFVAWITDETKTGVAEELLVQRPYLGGNTFREKWFRMVVIYTEAGLYNLSTSE